MSLQKVVIIGAGGFGREVLDIFLAENKVSPRWEILGFIDENPQLFGEVVNGYPVLGSLDWLGKTDINEIRVIVAIGDNKVRKKVVKKAESLGSNFCEAIHPDAIMTPFVSMGEGVIIAAGAILTNQIRIGNHVIINVNATIGHDAVIEDFVNINPGAHINGNNRVEEGAYIGSGAVTIQNITIGRWSIIGAGAVIIENTSERVIAVGVPAKPIRSLEVEETG